MIRIGTAGWAIPSAEAARFPGDGTHLERYARMLSGVEINSSFYRPHRRSTYERWAASVPADFRFSVKLPKAISHEARLVDSEDALAAFADQIQGLGASLGVVLVQLPPSLDFDDGVASPFFAALRRCMADTVGIACEPRHASWFEAAAEACLSDHRVARVAADPVRAPEGERTGGWSGLRYHRLHGAPRIYYSPYDDARLAALGETLRTTADAGEETWCIFDNTASGAATGDALALRTLTAV